MYNSHLHKLYKLILFMKIDRTEKTETHLQQLPHKKNKILAPQLKRGEVQTTKNRVFFIHTGICIHSALKSN